MPEIIDLMAPPLNLCASFVANNLVESVAITIPAGDKIIYNAFGESRFSKGDSFRILSLGVHMGEAFSFRKSIAVTPFIQLSLVPLGVPSGDTYAYPGFASGLQYAMMECYEQVSDIYFPCKDAYGVAHPANNLLLEDFRLTLYPLNVYNVSMLSIPATYTGKTFYVVPFIKVLHTIAFTG